MSVQGGFGIYGIINDPIVGYREMATTMCRRGLRFVQLRMKNIDQRDLLRVARSIRPLIPPTTFFIVNDHPLVAREAGADGVHLGQDDMSLAQAREILGPNAIIGLSTHSPAQVRAARALSPDYIGVGPVFATPTKEVPDPVLGLDRMKRMLALADVPAVAIGGIDLGNLPSVLSAGARNFCAVRAINRSPDPGSVLDRMASILLRFGIS